MSSIILDGITVTNDNQLSIDYNSSNGMSTRLGKRQFIPYTKASKDMNGHTIYSVYYSPSDIANDIILSFKGQSRFKVSLKQYNTLLSRTARYISFKLLDDIDIIITPKTSSNMLGDLVSEIQSIKPHIKIFRDGFVKNDIDRISINYNHPKITDTISRSLENSLSKAKSLGTFNLKKINPSFRVFLTNIHDISSDTIMRAINGRNVCIIDDVLVTGTTLIQIINSVDQYGANRVIGITVFKK